MSAVLRFLFVIPLGFVAGCLAAAFALLWPFLDLAPGWWNDPFILFELFLGLVAQAGQIGAAALIPWAIFMVVTESLRWSSFLLHMATGAIAGLALAQVWYGGDAPAAIRTAMVVGGLAFFMVYWIVAGRSAGHWRRPPPSAPREDTA